MQPALGPYMVDFTDKLRLPFGPADTAGIPMFEPRHFRAPGPPLYHPVVIIQYALAQYDRWLNEDRNARESFLKCACWLAENAVADPGGRFRVWQYHFPLRTPPAPAPFVSGMAQGQGLSVFARAQQMAKDDHMAAVARQVARSFQFMVAEGGMMVPWPPGYLFVEEIAVEPSIHILNGCLYALVGLHEYLLVAPDPVLQTTLHRCLDGVEAALPHFDLGWWSRYSTGLRWNIASTYYHTVHVRQLQYLGVLFQRPVFQAYAEKWQAAANSPAVRARQRLVEFLHVNANRVLTVLRQEPLKYRSRY